MGAESSTVDHPYGTLRHFYGRSPQPVTGLPAGIRVVSADNHFSMGGQNVWVERVPEHLKERVPSVWFDEGSKLWITGMHGKNVYPYGSAEFQRSMEGNPGSWNVDVRTEDLAIEGVEKEIAFPHLIGFAFHLKDFEARSWIFRIYNEYLAECQARQPGHFYGVGIPNYWDPLEFRTSILEIKSLGLKTFMLPSVPGKSPDGSVILYNEKCCESLWAAAAEADLPVCFHVAESFNVAGRGIVATQALDALGGGNFRKNFGELVFGGVLDRHPSLRIVFAEAGLSWVPAMLRDVDMVHQCYAGLYDYEPILKPSEYWYRNCFATFINDPTGLVSLDRIGVAKAMWSMDYMHNESTFGYTSAVMQNILKAVGEKNARKILGGNAIELFNLDDDVTIA